MTPEQMLSLLALLADLRAQVGEQAQAIAALQQQLAAAGASQKEASNID